MLATTDEDRQGRILGICVGLTYLGLSLGPVAGGLLTEYAGWRSIFLLSAAMALQPICSSARCVRMVCQRRALRQRRELGLSMAGIVLFLWGLSAYAETSLPLWAGLLLLLAFILHESRSYHPLLPLYIFRSVSFSMSNLAAFIQYSATYAMSFLLSLYLQVLTAYHRPSRA